MKEFGKSTLQRALATVVAALLALTGLLASTPAASAGAYMHIKGNACSSGGGWIDAMFFNTQRESGGIGSGGTPNTGNITFGSNAFNIHLSDYQAGNTTVWFSVKCNNGQWYYPSRVIPWYAVNPYSVGSI